MYNEDLRNLINKMDEIINENSLRHPRGIWEPPGGSSTTAKVRDFRGYTGPTDAAPMTEVKVGDWVGFKSDIEQSGKIVKIERRGRDWNLFLENEYGFQGGYIGGMTKTTELASDCWVG